MKVALLTSGFPYGFTEEFIQCIKKYYKSNGAFVVLASDFEEHLKTDKYTDIFLNMFKDKGITFNEVHIIDNRISKEKAEEYIEKAEIVWLSGGDTLKQIKYLKEYNLIPKLQRRDGITIGMSAGSINMAKRVVLPKDLSDNIPKLSIYEGIGLVDINVEPHLDLNNKEHMKEIYEATKYSTIYGIYDNSFIEIIDNTMEIYGEYQEYKKIDK